MANANKNKGKAWEREFAKDMIKVFGLNFNRVPNSGAFTGGKNVVNNAYLTEEQKQLMTGDIIVPKEFKRVSFECKFYKDFAFNALLTNNSILDGWIKQAFILPEKYTFLIFKINNKGAFVVIDEKTKSAINVTSESYFVYKSNYFIYKYEGFFDKNKEAILKLSL